MQDMELIIKDDIYVTSYTSVVNTTCYILYSGRSFPDNKWTDFVFPILEEWKYNLLKIEKLVNTLVYLYFHDGPFWLEVYKDDSMNLKIECINDRKEKYSEMTIYYGYYDFLKCIQNTLKSFIKILYKNNMNEKEFSGMYKQSIISKNEIEEVLKNRYN